MARWLQISVGVLAATLALFFGVRMVGCSRSVSADKLAQQALTASPQEQCRAAATLVTLPQADRREPLRRVVQESTSPPVLSTAVLGLAGQWDYDSMPRILELLDHPSPDVRAAAGAAAKRMMCMDLGFQANDPPEKRQLAVVKLREHWEWFRDSSRLKWWKQRLENDELNGRVSSSKK